MKKVFAFLAAMMAMTAVMAQGSRNRTESRDVILGQQNEPVYPKNDRYDRNDRYGNSDDRYNNRYNTREREAQIQRIRKEYKWKIESVQRDRHLRKAEKKRKIRTLEQQRDREIRLVKDRFDRYNRNRRY